MLRDVRGLRPQGVPEARPGAVRLQRMRQAERLPAQEALLRRGRRAGQLPGHPQGREFLERLGIRRINADCVTLDPSLLGPDFKREAANAILRKKGVME